MFGIFVDTKQCQHIYFAVCHDAGYGSVLTPYKDSGRITRIKTASFHRDFEGLGFPTHELPSVFMSTPLITKIPNLPAYKKLSTPVSPGAKPEKVFRYDIFPCKAQRNCTLNDECGQQCVIPSPRLDIPDDSLTISNLPWQSLVALRRLLPQICLRDVRKQKNRYRWINLGSASIFTVPSWAPARVMMLARNAALGRFNRQTFSGPESSLGSYWRTWTCLVTFFARERSPFSYHITLYHLLKYECQFLLWYSLERYERGYEREYTWKSTIKRRW